MDQKIKSNNSNSIPIEFLQETVSALSDKESQLQDALWFNSGEPFRSMHKNNPWLTPPVGGNGLPATQPDGSLTEPFHCPLFEAGRSAEAGGARTDRGGRLLRLRSFALLDPGALPPGPRQCDAAARADLRPRAADGGGHLQRLRLRQRRAAPHALRAQGRARVLLRPDHAPQKAAHDGLQARADRLRLHPRQVVLEHGVVTRLRQEDEGVVLLPRPAGDAAVAKLCGGTGARAHVDAPARLVCAWEGVWAGGGRA